MNTLVFALLIQASTSFIVSTKAGLVNYVQGASTVKPATTIPAGKVFGTGPGGAVEVLLNPGSYLRLGENTQVILDKVELYDIAIHVLQGSAIVESNGFDKDTPLKVTTGDLHMEIIKDGIYLFADGKVVIVEGKIRDSKNGLIYGKGYQISDDQGYRAQKVKTFTTALELWSQQRDAQIAKANVNVAKSLSRPGVPGSSFQDVWLWWPAFGSFIYMPGRGYRSPYGYSYSYVNPPVYGGGGGRSAGNFGGGGNNGINTPPPSAGNSGGGGGGGGFSGGGGNSSIGAGPGPAASSGGISNSNMGGGGGRPAGPSKSVSP